MTEKSRFDFNQLSPGFEFPAESYILDESTIRDYLQATGDTSNLYRQRSLAPPLAVAALAMAALSEKITLPPGTIHVSQELAFCGVVFAGDRITCSSKVSRKVDRGGLRLMSTDITVTNQDGKTVLTGRVGFVLPDKDKIPG
ncbi:MAG: MaoC family dehydratase N-terminal domain-containing protein [Dehalococcoidales bacterium]|jgi:hypothetical protein|nr:MaoC family dehydratase N-terminal domain-containing protein [Dehalococcoidales bacterium]